MTAVAAGTVDLTFAEVTSAQELVKSGKLRALAVASEQRVPPLPDVPTASEAGMPDFTAYTWVAAVVSAETPKGPDGQGRGMAYRNRADARDPGVL